MNDKGLVFYYSSSGYPVEILQAGLTDPPPVPTSHYTSHLFDAYVYRCSSQRARVSFMTCSVNIVMSTCNDPS